MSRFARWRWRRFGREAKASRGGTFVKTRSHVTANKMAKATTAKGRSEGRRRRRRGRRRQRWRGRRRSPRRRRQRRRRARGIAKNGTATTTAKEKATAKTTENARWETTYPTTCRMTQHTTYPGFKPMLQLRQPRTARIRHRSGREARRWRRERPHAGARSLAVDDVAHGLRGG